VVLEIRQELICIISETLLTKWAWQAADRLTSLSLVRNVS